MCKISDKLKLCSCAEEIDYDKDHWVVNRFVEGKQAIIIGMTVMPNFIDPEIIKANKNKLAIMLNQAHCFDFEVEFHDKDQLVMFFSTKTPFYQEFMYAFEFKDNSWNSIETEPLMLNWYHDTIMEGYIKTLADPESKA